MLRARGIRALLIDVDNTVSPHHSPVVIPEIRAWLDSLAVQGFAAILVSNNWHGDIADRAADLGLPVVSKAKKPLPWGLKRAANMLNLPISECAVVGDQLFTDILGGNLAGAVTVLVVPLTTIDLPHTRILRRLERVIMKGRVAKA